VGGQDEDTEENTQEENGRNNMRMKRGKRNWLGPTMSQKEQYGLVARWSLAMLQLMLPMSFERVDEVLP
jgi:hypothetical protein